MRYIVHAPSQGVPPIGTVLTPGMTRPFAAWSSRGQIFGAPGTIPIQAPNSPLPRNNAVALAQNGVFSTAHAPAQWYPGIYFPNETPKEKFPGSTVSDNQIPVPALRPSNVIISETYKSRKGGQRQVYQPQVVQTWRGMRGTTNG